MSLHSAVAWLFVVFLFVAACRQPDTPASQAATAGEWRTFEGTWTATGTRRTLRLGPNERAGIFELTGSVLLTGAERPAVRVQGAGDRVFR